jgi:hypothetical protein
MVAKEKEKDGERTGAKKEIESGVDTAELTRNREKQPLRFFA